METREPYPPVDPELAAVLGALLEEGNEVDATKLIAADLEESGISYDERLEIAAGVVEWLLS